MTGVRLVNAGGERCEACEQRPAVGPSMSGHLVCARCAGLASTLADELAAEIESSRQRRALRASADRPIVRQVLARLERTAEATKRTRGAEAARRRSDTLTSFPCGHDRKPTNVYTRPDGRRACRECRRVRSTEAKRKARVRERERMKVSRSRKTNPILREHPRSKEMLG
jgi:hypothetical protein